MSRIRRNLNDWELDEMCSSLLGLLDGLRPVPVVRDRWECVISRKGCFSSKSFCVELVNHRFPTFPRKHIWILVFLQKFGFFYMKCVSR